MTCLLKGVGITAGVPRTADDLAAIPKSVALGQESTQDAIEALPTRSK
jgi:hypothetical protein